MAKGDDSVIIPNSHRGEDIGVDLLTKVLKQAGISREDWLNAK
jgi:predicted RNA binding protein YcfA (HicA-like mRNA interferase family)